ncbi:replication protein A 70 kDa DNA-binding subunit B [Artemisia annua]|uniref:Replication protein A 70 kDa DNA-binding subunit B n=1 Tax=Artemisia annua TaxID=35608 RepID=A0A2U1PEU8_ARTAN|nr:replication protein A 70 kDa DNA-binding subunit B [Artemisia annua]
MDQQITMISQIDPMLDDVKIVVSVISIWKSHPFGKPNQTWGVEVILQDQEGNRIQASIKADSMNRFNAILDEGSCYRISNFGVGENGGKFPLLSHKFKISFFKNTAVTRVNNFDNNQRGFCFEPFTNFNLKSFDERDMVVISISQPIPFEYLGKEKMRKTVILQDIEGAQLECCFFDDWINKLDAVSNHQNESLTPVVMILQHARLYIDKDLPEIHAFRKRYQEVDGYDATKSAISVYTPVKKEDTPEEFCAGGIKKKVGCIRESAWSMGKSTKSTENTDGRILVAKDVVGLQNHLRRMKMILRLKKQVQSSKTEKANTQFWTCKVHKKITAIGPKYKVILRVIDDTGSASLLLFDDMINTLVDIPCYKLKEQYGPGVEDMFPEELTNRIVGKRLLFRFTYTEWAINNNHHTYQVTKMSNDAEFIKLFKKDFIMDETDDSLETPVSKSVGDSQPSSILRYNESIPFNLEYTPTGKDTAGKSSEGGSGSSGKRTVIDLDDFEDEEYEARKGKRAMEYPNSNKYGSTNIGQTSAPSNSTTSTISTIKKTVSSPLVSTSVLTQANVINTPEISKSVLPKRGYGRPHKNPVTTNHTSQDVALQSSQPSVLLPKRGRGRPRKNLVTTNHTSPDVVLQTSQASVPKPFNSKKSIPNQNFVTNSHVDQANVISCLTQLPPSKVHLANQNLSQFSYYHLNYQLLSIPNSNLNQNSPNLVSSNKGKYNLHTQNNENANPLKNKFNDAKSSDVSNKHLTTVGKRAPLSDITSSTTSMINESISTFHVTTPFVSQQTNVTITPEASNSVVTHRGRGRPRTTPLTTNSSYQVSQKHVQIEVVVGKIQVLDLQIITLTHRILQMLYQQMKTLIRTSTIPNPTSNLEDRAHIKGKSIPTENEIVSSDEETEDEHGYIDRISGISKGTIL